MISDETWITGQATGLLGYQKQAYPTVYKILVVTDNKPSMTYASKEKKTAPDDSPKDRI